MGSGGSAMTSPDPFSAGGWRLACEIVVFIVFVCGTSLTPVLEARWRAWRARLGGEGGEGGKHGYVLASGVSTLAMILSVSRGTLGVRSFLGIPAELAYRGSGMLETVYGMTLAFPLVAWLLVPLYLGAGYTSIYEYLEVRFGGGSGGRAVRRVCALLFVCRQLLSLAVTVYAPCVALQAAVGAPPALTAAAVALAAALPTLKGNLTTHIRTDVIQSVTMVVVSLLFVAQASWRAGGVAQVWRDNRDAGRLSFFTFSWGSTVTARVDTLSATLGQLAMSASVFGCQQTFAARYVSLGSVKRARRTLLLAAGAVAALFVLGWCVGASVFAVFARCDPLAAGRTHSPDHLLPYYVRTELGAAPGLNGLFLAVLFNGALSLLVSNVNSLACVTWEDFVSALPPCRAASERTQVRAIKGIALTYCVVICSLSLLVGRAGGAVEAAALVTSCGGGALLGVFVVAALAPGVSARGVLAAALAAALLPAALAAARLAVHDQASDLLPTTTAGCVNGSIANVIDHSVSLVALLVRTAPLNHTSGAVADTGVWTRVVSTMASVSYMWYALLGVSVCVCVSVCACACGGARVPVSARLVHPIVARLAQRVPAVARLLHEPHPESRAGHDNKLFHLEPHPESRAGHDNKLFHLEPHPESRAGHDNKLFHLEPHPECRAGHDNKLFHLEPHPESRAGPDNKLFHLEPHA